MRHKRGCGASRGGGQGPPVQQMGCSTASAREAAVLEAREMRGGRVAASVHAV